MVLHSFVELRKAHAKCLLDCLLGWHFLVFYEIEVSAHLLQLVLAQQIVHEYPRLGVEQRVVRSFLPTHDTVLHSEKVWPG